MPVASYSMLSAPRCWCFISRCCGPARVASVCCSTPRPASRVALPATERHPLCAARFRQTGDLRMPGASASTCRHSTASCRVTACRRSIMAVVPVDRFRPRSSVCRRTGFRCNITSRCCGRARVASGILCQSGLNEIRASRARHRTSSVMRRSQRVVTDVRSVDPPSNIDSHAESGGDWCGGRDTTYEFVRAELDRPSTAESLATATLGGSTNVNRQQFGGSSLKAWKPVINGPHLRRLASEEAFPNPMHSALSVRADRSHAQVPFLRTPSGLPEPAFGTP